MLKVRTKYSPGICEYKNGYHEIRWDLSGCNLRCHFCWSPASRPDETHDPSSMLNTDEIVNKTQQAIKNPRKTFIRFTGGEPTLQWPGIKDVIEKIINSPYNIPILIQTNGIEIGKGRIETDILCNDDSQLFLFELSFKGTNSREFQLLTGKDGSLFKLQLKGYRMLEKLSEFHKNIAVVAVLGVYHSSVKGNSKYVFVDQATGKLLFENPSNWDERFKLLWLNAPLKWVEPLRMSPIGVWKNLLRRCGEDGRKILKHFPTGAPTNEYAYFPPKPKSYEYARRIINREFWGQKQKSSKVILRKKRG